jgi:hypothetical protein
MGNVGDFDGHWRKSISFACGGLCSFFSNGFAGWLIYITIDLYLLLPQLVGIRNASRFFHRNKNSAFRVFSEPELLFTDILFLLEPLTEGPVSKVQVV